MRMCRHGSDQSGYEELMGDTLNISEWLDFAFYNLVWYHVPSNEPTTPPRALSRWLGVSHQRYIEDYSPQEDAPPTVESFHPTPNTGTWVLGNRLTMMNMWI